MGSHAGGGSGAGGGQAGHPQVAGGLPMGLVLSTHAVGGWAPKLVVVWDSSPSCAHGPEDKAGALPTCNSQRG